MPEFRGPVPAGLKKALREALEVQVVRFEYGREPGGACMLREVEQLVALARKVCCECDEVLRTGLPEGFPIGLTVTVEARQDHPWLGIPRVACSLHEVED